LIAEAEILRFVTRICRELLGYLKSSRAASRSRALWLARVVEELKEAFWRHISTSDCVKGEFVVNQKLALILLANFLPHFQQELDLKWDRRQLSFAKQCFPPFDMSFCCTFRKSVGTIRTPL